MKIARNLDKIGSFGAVLAAAMAPCCFPLLGVIGTALGLGGDGAFCTPVAVCRPDISRCCLGRIVHCIQRASIVSAVGTDELWNRFVFRSLPFLLFRATDLLGIRGLDRLRHLEHNSTYKEEP